MNQLFTLALSTVLMLGTSTVNTAKEIAATPVVHAQEILILEPVPERDCSCVEFARTLVPSLPLGDAKDLKPTSPYPRVGSVIIINSNGTYHLAYQYAKVDENGNIPLHDFNWRPCEEMWHSIHIDDPRFVGSWSDVI